MNLPRRLCCAIAFSAAPLRAARADSGWDGVGIVFGFGVVPLLVLLAAFIFSLFIARASWLDKLWTAIAIAATVLAQVILLASHTIDPPMFTVILLWLLPAAAWWATATWLRRRRATR